ncbi:MAG: acyltransferase [Deltaproteobacteria bacterium]|nr:acyltransferase [Deltaproteobacteria bacterium]
MSLSIKNRIYHKLAGVSPGGSSIRPWLHRRRGVTIGKNVWISQYVYIDELHPEALIIGDNCSIGLRSSIFTHFYWGPRREDNGFGPVVIEEDVFVGPHCVILPQVRIGRGSVIKAGTVVSRNVPRGVFWGTPSPEAQALVGIPLISDTGYLQFLRGLKPIRRKH